MPTIFNCSMCSAPLDMATANGMTIRCPYCGNTSILPEELRSGVASGAASEPIAEGFVPMIDHALKLAEVAKLAKTGNKIAAIKLYRETFGGKLEDAKNAVEQMESGQPIVFNQTFRGTNASAQTFPQSFQPAQFVSPQAIKRTKRGAGIVVLIVILIPLTAAVFNLGHWIFKSVINLALNSRMTDPFTMFKVFRRDALFGIDFVCNRFDFDIELVMKLVRKGYVPLELPVNYVARSFAEGKKVSITRDGLTWLWTILKLRLSPIGRGPD